MKNAAYIPETGLHQQEASPGYHGISSLLNPFFLSLMTLVHCLMAFMFNGILQQYIFFHKAT